MKTKLIDSIMEMLSVINPNYDRIAVYKHLSQLSEERLMEEHERIFDLWEKGEKLIKKYELWEQDIYKQ